MDKKEKEYQKWVKKQKEDKLSRLLNEYVKEHPALIIKEEVNERA